jgi:hypothetical protein
MVVSSLVVVVVVMVGQAERPPSTNSVVPVT